MRNKFAVLLVAFFILALTSMLMPKKANAITAFAQKYHFSCQVCHINGFGGGSRLTPFGRAFQRNGFMLPGTNGTPADATEVAQGLSLPNPWPIPVMMEVNIGYGHQGNENLSNAVSHAWAPKGTTDEFTAEAEMHTGGAFKLYTPLANSLSWYTGIDVSPSSVSMDNTFGVLDGVGAGLGLPSHLINVSLGYDMNMYNPSPYFFNAGHLSMGYDSNSAGVLGEGAGFQVYGTPGYHLWYMVGVTNGAANAGGKYAYGSPTGSANNSMNYNYSLKEFAPTSFGTLELDYFGGTVAEPLTVNGSSWTNRVSANGVGVGLANGVYEIGVAFDQVSDSNPYGNPSGTLPSYIDNTSNGYQEFGVFGAYALPGFITPVGTNFNVTYSQYSYTHENTQEAFNNSGAATACAEQSLYGGQVPSNTGGFGCEEGLKNNLALSAVVFLASNTDLTLSYNFANIQEYDQFTMGLEFAF